MGDTAVISYRSLGEASSEARQVSRKLTGYADSLQRSIVNRLDSYGGSDSGGVTQAKRRTEEKIEQLRDKAQAYTKYADDLQTATATWAICTWRRRNIRMQRIITKRHC